MSGDNEARQPTCCETLCSLLLFQVVGGLVMLFLGGFIMFVCWAFYKPHQIRATVASATLSNLTVVSSASSAGEVSYNLAVNLSLFNPSSDVDIYYDTINAELRFRDAVLGPAANGTSPPEFYQRTETSHDVRLEFDYGRGVAVASDAAGELQTEVKSGGAVSLDLHVHLRVSYTYRTTIRQKTRVRCSLSIPVKAEGRGPGVGVGVGGAVASGDQCRVKYPRW
ncbi:hypothetical protein PVAP13_3KG028900 [Panicum virgatum]|uniref:Late embryogenesis abundant protein LEA-2 subgroup domain-containing protein n=2 Tax=Panicum virgatum TaxID=38727 RepID=A0A8T0UQK6_PANVG|nr:hypothetical protein PVAP13_3KG028900 [Panicum virgatum]